MKLAAAPISWGVCEVPDWGIQLSPERVLSDMRGLGVVATEAGPPGFLPEDTGAVRTLLESCGLRLVGGFVTAQLHEPGHRRGELEGVTRQADWLARAGAEVLVLAASTGESGYSAVRELSSEGWRELFEGIDRVGEIAHRRGLVLAVHPHFGTVIERRSHVERFLDGCAHALCLDTGHLALGGADPLKVARDAGPRVRHVHLKDVDDRLAQDVRDGEVAYADAVRRGLYRPLGDGVARIADVLAHLKEERYAGWYVLEQDVMLSSVPPPGPPKHVVRSLEFAKQHG